MTFVNLYMMHDNCLSTLQGYVKLCFLCFCESYDKLTDQISFGFLDLRGEFKIRQKVLTLKCNYNSLKICGALWDNYAYFLGN